MLKKFKSYLVIAASMLMMGVPLAVPSTVAFAQGCGSNIGDQVAKGASEASGGTVDCSGTGVNGDNIANIAKNIVNIFSIVVGGVAVIMIIYGGFRYITSGGDSGSVGNAKNTLIYAIVGLIIVALAQLIVHFVLNQAVNATSSQ